MNVLLVAGVPGISGEKLRKRRQQLRGEPAELFAMAQGQFSEEAFPQWGDFEQDLAKVVHVAVTPNHAVFGQSMREFDHAVILELEPPGEFADRRDAAGGEAFEGQEKLVLLRTNARLSGGLFAEDEKTPDEVAERG